MIEIDERPTTRDLPRFVPVIFANGEDDDAPGLQACVDNEAVQFDDRVYEPGEDVEIYGRHIVFYRNVTGGGHGRMTYITECIVEGRWTD